MEKKKELSINQSNSGLSQNSQLASQTGAGFNNTEEGQNYLDNFTFSHLSNQDNNHTRASTDVEAENITKAAVETQQNSLVFGSKTEDGIVIGTGKSGFPNSQDVNSSFSQTQNNIGVNALVTEESKHKFLGSYFQNFLFTQNPGGVAEGNLSILNRNARVLSGNVVKAIAPLEKVKNISDGNSRSLDAGLAKSDRLFDNNTGGSGSFDNVVHEDNYNKSVKNLSNS